ncbi:putative expansin-B2 [Senna tora]|uniref:Putative expansin-B2 n=1 Tax=Senna tora TaxID=362788 RepID=A0A834XJB1_9FABA|nr:putative expansin-B2 [Senna tora]
MALFTLQFAFSHFLTLLAFLSFFLVSSSSCYNPRKLQDASNSDWSETIATWYGSPDGAGSDGGACGYGNTVSQPPFSSLVSAGGQSLFDSGKGCGSCYEVKCTANSACSGKEVRVVITDECPGCATSQFDLSGTAFGAMAISGQENALRNVGKLNIQVECNYPGISISFKVDSGSSQNYFAVMTEYEDGDGSLAKMELKDAQTSSSWLSMQQSWGATWKLDSPSNLQPPFSLRLTSAQSGQTVVADNVIPAGWQPGQTYRSVVNFNP